MGRSKDVSDERTPKKAAKPDSPEAAEPPRLTRYELEIMDVVWRLGEATVHDVCEGLTRPLAYTTVMTTLSLLEGKKGVLERTKQGRSFVYRPLVSRDEVSRTILTDLKEVLFGDSVGSLVLNLMSDKSVTAEDVSRLRKALEDLEQKK
jgi:predicted transcriptional regulator